MATLSNGILGGGRNKVGPVIMSKWKGINYIRSYAKPSNPNTPAQQNVRTKFAQLVDYARQILSTILKPYWDPFYSNQSGFNAWISSNYQYLDNDLLLTDSSILSKGSLTNVSVNSSVYNSSSGVLNFTWSVPPQGDILTTDFLCAAVFHSSSRSFLASGNLSLVSTHQLNIQLPVGLEPSSLLLFYFTFRGAGSGLSVSDSSTRNVQSP
jgi:hypothetical protein